MFWQLYTFLCCLLKLLFYTVTVQAANASNKNKIIKRLLQCAFLVCVYVQGLMCDWVWPSSYCYFLCLSSITLTTCIVTAHYLSLTTCIMIALCLWPCLSKWVKWILGHFLLVAYFRRKLPFLRFGVFSKITLQSFSHQKLYSLCTI